MAVKRLDVFIGIIMAGVFSGLLGLPIVFTLVFVFGPFNDDALRLIKRILLTAGAITSVILISKTGPDDPDNKKVD